MSRNARRLVLRVSVVEQDAEGKVLRSLCDHTENDPDCEMTRDRRWREQLLRQAYEGFLRARNREFERPG